MKLPMLVLGAGCWVLSGFSPTPNTHHPSPLSVTYRLRVDSSDVSGFDVEMAIHYAADSFRVAMVAHPEYDDRFYRYVTNLTVDAPGGASIVRVDSAVWRVIASGGSATIRYRIVLPAPDPSGRGAWIPFIRPTGALVGGPHAFMYVLGETRVSSRVILDLPAGWTTATGLEATADPHTFAAPTVEVLADSPILVGHLRSWTFAVDGVPHRVVYWPRPDAVPFDTTVFVGGIERVVRQTIALFGRAPYRDYTFLVQDGAYGALEHRNSVTLGARSTDLARDPLELMSEASHEYFHTWNLMRIHPDGYGAIDYRTQAPSRGLWFSEGLSMFYADLLQRRAGIRVSDSTRMTHLAGLISRYLASPGNSRISAERVSMVAYNAEPGALGDYSASTHLQGEIIGAMLDVLVRDATGGRRTIDDVMRAMMDRFSGERGFAGRDVEETVAAVCGCSVRAFFDAHVRGGTPIPFERYLALMGLRMKVERRPVLDPAQHPVAEVRIFAWQPDRDSLPHLLLFDPATSWGRAGLHTGDRIVAINGAPLRDVNTFRAVFRRLVIGDTVRIDVLRPSGPYRAEVVLQPYVRPFVELEEIPAASARQRELRERWMAGN